MANGELINNDISWLSTVSWSKCDFFTPIFRRNLQLEDGDVPAADGSHQGDDGRFEVSQSNPNLDESLGHGFLMPNNVVQHANWISINMFSCTTFYFTRHCCGSDLMFFWPGQSPGYAFGSETENVLFDIKIFQIFSNLYLNVIQFVVDCISYTHS